MSRGKRVETGCSNCKRCTNSGAAEFGRKQTKLWANVMTLGSVSMAQAFTADCRACGHKMSLHAKVEQPQAPMAQRVPPPSANVPAGWYPDPNGAPCTRWWDGQAWTDSTAPSR